MRDDLLIGWSEIYTTLFCNGSGKPLISINTLIKKHGPRLKASGAIFKWKRGHARTPCVAGWTHVIQNHFIKLGQEDDAERVKAKLAKASNNSK